MAETPDGQQTPAAMAPDAPVIPAAPTVPAEATPTPQPSGGRSVEELFNEMEELKRTNAELADKAARAEHEATYTRNLIETFRQGAPKQEEQAPTIPDITDDEFLTNPGKATTKVVTAFFERERAEREREKKEQYVERARSLFETGEKTATEKLGRLMAGIENEVKQQVRDGIISGAITPDAALDPDLWAVTAMAYRFKVKGERNLDKYFSESRTPMAPQHTETPTAGSPPKAEMTLTPEQEEAISKGHITREQFLQAMATEKSIQAGRNR